MSETFKINGFGIFQRITTAAGATECKDCAFRAATPNSRGDLIESDDGLCFLFSAEFPEGERRTKRLPQCVARFGPRSTDCECEAA